MFADMVTGLNRIECGALVCSIEASRMSGEMDTSLSNGVINLLIAMAVAEQVGSCVHGYVEGDDGIFVFHDGTGAVPTASHYASFGAKIKIDLPRLINEAAFCGNVYAVGVCRNTTDPIDFLAKFGWYFSAACAGVSPAVSKMLLRAKAMSALAEYHGCPIITAFARYILRACGQGRAKWSLDGTIPWWDSSVIGPYRDTLTLSFELG